MQTYRKFLGGVALAATIMTSTVASAAAPGGSLPRPAVTSGMQKFTGVRASTSSQGEQQFAGASLFTFFLLAAAAAVVVVGVVVVVDSNDSPG
jgi:hypothetical protein